MSNQPSNYVLLLDIGPSWVRSLFSGLPGLATGERHLRAWNIHSVGYWLGRHRQLSSLRAGRPKVPGIIEDDPIIPGWTRFPRLSSVLLANKVKRLMRRLGSPEVIVYNLPQYAKLADAFQDYFQVYYAYDAYRFYGSAHAHRVDDLEKRILDACDVAFAISNQLVEDLRQKTQTPVFYSPNAVSESFVTQLAHQGPVRLPEFNAISGKVVGCVGQISASAYNWRLIECLAKALPELTFVFIGPLMDDPPGSLERVAPILHLSNVRWFGPRPHSELCSFIAGFDICFGPYAVTPLKNRGSPLRMYDYLCTTKPVLFTPISEVCKHWEYVEIGATAEECVCLIRKMLAADYRIDLASRRRFISENTWEQRATELWKSIVRSREAWSGSGRAALASPVN